MALPLTTDHAVDAPTGTPKPATVATRSVALRATTCADTRDLSAASRTTVPRTTDVALSSTAVDVSTKVPGVANWATAAAPVACVNVTLGPPDTDHVTSTGDVDTALSPADLPTPSSA